MEKKTIIPEKNKKHVFIENLIFCILIILVSIGGIIAWFCIQSKQNDIITNESMQLVEDTQKGVYTNPVTNISYNDNMVYLTDFTYVRDNNTNTILAPNNAPTGTLVNSYPYGVGGSSFVQYTCRGTDTFNYDSTLQLYDFFHFKYALDTELLLNNEFDGNYFFASFFDITETPLYSVLEDNFVGYRNFYTYLKFYNNDTLLCNILLSCDGFVIYSGVVLNYVSYNIIYIDSTLQLDVIDELCLNIYYVNYDSSSLLINRVEYDIYGDSQVFDTEVDNVYYSYFNNCVVGLYCYTDDFLLLACYDNDRFQSISSFNLLPNYYKFVSYDNYTWTLETISRVRYNQGYNTAKQEDEVLINQLKGKNYIYTYFNNAFYQVIDPRANENDNIIVSSNIYYANEKYNFNYGSYLVNYVQDNNYDLTRFHDYDLVITPNTPIPVDKFIFAYKFNVRSSGDARIFSTWYYFTDGTSSNDLVGNESKEISSYSMNIETGTWNLIEFEGSYLGYKDIVEIYDYGTNTAYANGYGYGYSDGYTYGYDTGYNDGDLTGRETGYNDGYDIGYNEGVDYGVASGYSSAYADGFSSGKLVGYNQGVNSTSTTGGLITSLFSNIANVPVIIFNGLFPASVLNIPIISILFGMLAIAVIIFLIRKFI